MVYVLYFFFSKPEAIAIKATEEVEALSYSAVDKDAHEGGEGDALEGGEGEIEDYEGGERRKTMRRDGSLG